MQRRLITVSIDEDAIFFVCLYRLFYHMCLKCPPSSRIRALSGAPLVSGCVDCAFFNVVLNVIFMIDRRD